MALRHVILGLLGRPARSRVLPQAPALARGPARPARQRRRPLPLARQARGRGAGEGGRAAGPGRAAAPRLLGHARRPTRVPALAALRRGRGRAADPRALRRPPARQAPLRGPPPRRRAAGQARPPRRARHRAHRRAGGAPPDRSPEPTGGLGASLLDLELRQLRDRLDWLEDLPAALDSGGRVRESGGRQTA